MCQYHVKPLAVQMRSVLVGLSCAIRQRVNLRTAPPDRQIKFHPFSPTPTEALVANHSRGSWTKANIFYITLLLMPLNILSLREATPALVKCRSVLKEQKQNRQKLLLILIKRSHLKYRSRSPLPVFALSYARL